MEKEPEFQEIDEQINKIREIINQDIDTITRNLSDINESFLELFKEYERIAEEASSDLNEGMIELFGDSPVNGIVKLFKGLFKKGVSWWKKRKWFQEFQRQKTAIYSERMAIISKRLSNLNEAKEKHIPFIRETVKRILIQIGSFNLKKINNEKIKEMAVERAEESLLIFLKTYYIEGAALYLESVYRDLQQGKMVVGQTFLMQKHLERGVTGTKAMVYKLKIPRNSAVFEALNRNTIFSGVKKHGKN